MQWKPELLKAMIEGASNEVKEGFFGWLIADTGYVIYPNTLEEWAHIMVASFGDCLIPKDMVESGMLDILDRDVQEQIREGRDFNHIVCKAVDHHKDKGFEHTDHFSFFKVFATGWIHREDDLYLVFCIVTTIYKCPYTSFVDFAHDILNDRHGMSTMGEGHLARIRSVLKCVAEAKADELVEEEMRELTVTKKAKKKKKKNKAPVETGSAAAAACLYEEEEAGVPAVKEVGCQTDKEEKRLGECVICMDALSTVVIMPCMHLCLCEACSSLWRDSCPICRVHITDRIKILLP